MDWTECQNTKLIQQNPEPNRIVHMCHNQLWINSESKTLALQTAQP